MVDCQPSPVVLFSSRTQLPPPTAVPRCPLRPAAGRPRKGSVKLVFEAPDGEEVHFERAIKPTGAGADSFTSEVCVAAAGNLRPEQGG